VIYDSAPTSSLDLPTSLHVPQDEPTTFIAMLRQFSSDATALLDDLAEARPLIRNELVVKTHDGGQLIYALVECATTLDFVSVNFV
jgi:hypothetical protein